MSRFGPEESVRNRLKSRSTLKAIDPRLPRFEHTVLALAVTSGFVFEVPQVIPVWGVLALLSAVRPEAAPVPRLYRMLVAPRVAPAAAVEEWPPWRAAAFVAAGLLGLGTLMLVIGDVGIAWGFGLAAASLGALAGVGGLCVGCGLHGRRRR